MKMKNKPVLKALLCLCLLTAGNAAVAQTVHFTPLFSEESSWTRRIQGLGISGDILVQLHDKNPGIALFSLPDGKALGEIPMEKIKTWHNNNAAFSSRYYKKGDEFPLLYASQEHVDEHRTIVYRITRTKDGAFKAQIVQTIIFPSPLEMGLYYPNLALDEENGRIYLTGYSRKSWNDPSLGNAIQILRFPLPDSRKAVVKLTTKDIQARYCSEFKVATQGAVVRSGKLYQAFGVPKYGVTQLVCTDLESGATLWTSPLNGIEVEPEGMAFWQGQLLIAGVDGIVYIGQITPASNASANGQ